MKKTRKTLKEAMISSRDGRVFVCIARSEERIKDKKVEEELTNQIYRFAIIDDIVETFDKHLCVRFGKYSSIDKWKKMQDIYNHLVAGYNIGVKNG